MVRASEGRTRKDAVSAGGVVYRATNEAIEIVICGRSAEGLWALPKGTPVQNETLAETAPREVEEETGLKVDITGELGHIQYNFMGQGGTVYDKRVEHYLMRPVGGELESHDHEFDTVKWVPAEVALRLLRYANEREIVRRALRLIEERNGT